MLRLSVGLVGVLLVLLLAGMGLEGQEKKDPPSKSTKTLPIYWKQLGLSSAQKDKVYSIKAEYHTKIDALTVQLKKLHEEEKAELAKVLTSDQRDQLRKIIESKVGGASAPTEPKKTAASKQ